MTQDKDIVEVRTEIVTKKSPGFREVAHKANAGISEAEALDKHTIGRYNDGDGKPEDGGDSSPNV